jgi:CRP-like cAMP-binding protein/glyoxylase-like metal-dependent hydrolase (beta-lactamase superfamily II)
LSPKNERITKLPRGGLRVETKAGPVQFGLPPETIKDSMVLGKQVPTHFVIPKIRFDRRTGINVAEFEFPAYFNFFILRRRINLITTPDGEKRARRVFQETLFGPETIDTDSEYSETVDPNVRADLTKECAFFRKNPFDPTTLLQTDTLLDFTHFIDGIATIEGGDGCTQIKIDGDEYAVLEDGVEVARVPGKVALPLLEVGDVAKTFEPPLFGITILGFSHGFDPKGKTTGFVLWINRRGLMVDPPINSGLLLKQNGIPPRLIDGLILTHCHADHDAGTFQKILEERRIMVMATPTVLGSFLRKYAALSGLEEDFLRRLFVFRPIRLGEPVRHYGGELNFYYSLHSIPAVGFEVYFGGKSFVFSGDTLYDPARIEAMYQEGVLSAGRRDVLLNPPFHHSVVLHEAGVPPLHTPVANLGRLSDDIKSRLYVCHIAQKDMPADQGLKLAKPGVENTIRIEVERPVHSEAIEILDLVGDIDFFRGFSIAKAREVLQTARRCRYPANSIIISKGAKGDRFFVIASGVACVETKAGGKNYTTGDYFGETSLVTGNKRNATILAVTDVEVIEFDRYDFLYLIRGTNVVERMRHLDEMRRQRSWDVINTNSVLSTLSSSQKTQLQAILRKRDVASGEVLWEKNSVASEAILVDEGQLVFEGGEDAGLTPFVHGAFLGDIHALRDRSTVCSTLKAYEAGAVFSIDRDDLIDFFDRNPGLQLAFLKARFVE